MIFSVQFYLESIAFNLGGMIIKNLIYIEDCNED